MNRIQRALATTGIVLAAVSSLVLVPPTPAHATLPTCSDSAPADPALGDAQDPTRPSTIAYRIAPDQRSLKVRFPPQTDIVFNTYLENTRTGERFGRLCEGLNDESDYVVQTWLLRDDEPDLIMTGVSRFMVNYYARRGEQ